MLLGLTALAIWLRWPALSTEGFHNEDAAGITYNADILRHGLLPMVDNVEVKAPGPFYLAWMVWGLFGRSIVALQGFACFWSVLSMWGIYAGGRIMYGARAAGVAALLYCMAAPISDSIDINYGAWMIAPYVWATVFFLKHQKTGALRWLLVAGITLAIGGLLKRQAAVLFPVFAGLLIIAPRLTRPEGWAAPRRLKQTALTLGAGLAIGFTPMVLYYLVNGAFTEFVSQYFFNKSGWKYVGGELDWADKIPRIGDGFLGFWEYMALPSLLMVMSVAASYRPGDKPSLRGTLLGGHFWLSFVGASLGFRFFKGYYLQLLPAAVWIAAHPSGPVTRWLSRASWPTRSRSSMVGAAVMLGCILAAATPAILGDADQLSSIRKRRLRARDLEAQRVARVIKANTDPDDRIWVWGRWAWPVYFHADRLSTTRYYKTLGIVTTNLTNTWRRPTKKTTFKQSPAADVLIGELEANPPKFITVSKNESYAGYTRFKTLLRTRYKRVPHLRMRSFVVYHRKDYQLRKPPRPNPRRKARKKKKKKSTKRTAPKTVRSATKPAPPAPPPPAAQKKQQAEGAQ